MNKDRELDTIIDNSFGMFLKEKENPIYLNIKDQAISQIKALYKPLGKKELLEIIKKEVFRQFYKSGVKNIWLEQETLADAIINAGGER